MRGYVQLNNHTNTLHKHIQTHSRGKKRGRERWWGRGRSVNENGVGDERRNVRWERRREWGRGRGRGGDGDGDRGGDPWMKTGWEWGRKRGRKRNRGDGNGDEDGNGDGNENGIGDSGGEAKKREKPHKTCRRNVGNRGDLSRTINKSVDKKGSVQ